MARAKIRIALTVADEVDAILRQLSVLIGTPKTAIINEILMDVAPALQTTLNAILEAKKGQHDLAIKSMVDLMAKASTALTQGQFDLGEVSGELKAAQHAEGKRGKKRKG